MISKSLVEMVKGRWREFKREPSAMFFVVLMPVVWIIILGLAFSSPRQTQYSLGLVPPAAGDTTRTALMEQITALFDHNEQIKVRQGEQQAVEKWLARGEVLVSIELGSDRQIIYHYDATNPEGRQAKIVIDDFIQRGLGRQDSIASTESPVQAVGSRYIDFLIPGLLALSMLTASLYGTGMTIVAHRRENLLKRYLATPMNPYEYILSHIIGRYMILAVEVVTVMATGILLFQFAMAGSWLTYLAICLLSTAAFMAIGILLGCRLSNTATYNGLNNLISLPMMILAGVWFSRANFPTWLSSLSDFLPLTASVEALRKVALESATLSELGFEIGLLAAYTLVATVAARKAFKWY